MKNRVKAIVVSIFLVLAVSSFTALTGAAATPSWHVTGTSGAAVFVQATGNTYTAGNVWGAVTGTFSPATAKAQGWQNKGSGTIYESGTTATVNFVGLGPNGFAAGSATFSYY